MTDFELTYEQALKIVETKDNAYTDDIQTLIKLLNKYRLRKSCSDGMNVAGWNVISVVTAKFYQDEVIARAQKYIVADCLKRIEGGTF